MSDLLEDTNEISDLLGEGFGMEEYVDEDELLSELVRLEPLTFSLSLSICVCVSFYLSVTTHTLLSPGGCVLGRALLYPWGFPGCLGVPY